MYAKQRYLRKPGRSEAGWPTKIACPQPWIRENESSPQAGAPAAREQPDIPPTMDYSKWDKLADSDDDDAAPDIPDDPVIQAAAALQEQQGGLTAAEQQAVWRQMPEEVRAVVDACNKALGAGPEARVGEAELEAALEAACEPGFAERGFEAVPTPIASLREFLHEDGLAEGWSRVFSAAKATSNWVPTGAAVADVEISVGVRRCTDFLTQPLTAFCALRLAGALGDASGKPLVIHVPGATNAFPGNESLGGDEKWRLLQALLPSNPPVTVVYVGPEVEPHPSRELKARQGRASCRVAAFRMPYQDYLSAPSAGEAPALCLAQNCGLNDGPTLEEWLPALEAVRSRGAVCALTFFDPLELSKSVEHLARLGFPTAINARPRGAIHCGPNPFASLFLGFMGGELFSVNSQLLLLDFRTNSKSLFTPTGGAVAGDNAPEPPPPAGTPTPTQLAFELVARAAVEAGQVTQADVDELLGRIRRCDGDDARERTAAQVLGAPPFFAPHRRVLVHGLASKPELNGLGANVLSSGMQIGSDGSARIPIMMTGGPTGVLACPDRPQQLLLRPGNLRLVPFDGVTYEQESDDRGVCPGRLSPRAR